MVKGVTSCGQPSLVVRITVKDVDDKTKDHEMQRLITDFKWPDGGVKDSSRARDYCVCADPGFTRIFLNIVHLTYLIIDTDTLETVCEQTDFEGAYYAMIFSSKIGIAGVNGRLRGTGLEFFNPTNGQRYGKCDTAEPKFMSFQSSMDSGFVLKNHPDRVYWVREMDETVRPQYL
jgi:hypothetical protein